MKGVDFRDEKISNSFGVELGMTQVWEQYKEKFTTVHYVSGVDEFDEYFKKVKFHETDSILRILSCINGIVFMITHKDKAMFFAFYRNQILELRTEDNIEISVRAINRVTKTLKSFLPVAPMVAGLIADSFVKIDSRKVKGKIYRLILSENGKENQIIFTSTNENNHKILTDTFVKKHLTNTIPEKDKRCFIATACYGDCDSPEVIILRDFRDRVLLTTTLGRLFVKIYYKISPALTFIIYRSETLKHLLRKYFLKPIVNFINN